ncbi:Farnesyl diphosphate synthase [bacterium HR19]|nr:Farnesyl diphosphate synthase [bacterium HR19]
MKSHNEKYLENKIESLKDELENFIRKSLKEDFSNFSDITREMVENSVMSSGKRIRPLLFSLISLSLGIPKKTIMHVSYGIELSHAFTLVHDDLIDRPIQRRGNPPIFKLAGEEIALLIGDLLFSKSIIPLSQFPKSSKFFIEKMCDVIEGQIIDVLWSKGKFNSHSQSEKEKIIVEIQSKKTSSLFRISSVLPAIIFEESNRLKSDKMRKSVLLLIKNLDMFGYHFGLAFQTLDDIKDIEEDRKINSPNILLILGKEKTYELLKSNVSRAEKYLNACEEIILALSKKGFKYIELLKFLVKETVGYEKII